MQTFTLKRIFELQPQWMNYHFERESLDFQQKMKFVTNGSYVYNCNGEWFSKIFTGPNLGVVLQNYRQYVERDMLSLRDSNFAIYTDFLEAKRKLDLHPLSTKWKSKYENLIAEYEWLSPNYLETHSDINALSNEWMVKHFERAFAILYDIVENNKCILEFPNLLIQEKMSLYWIKMINPLYEQHYNYYSPAENIAVIKFINEVGSDEEVRLDDSGESNSVTLMKYFQNIKQLHWHNLYNYFEKRLCSLYPSWKGLMPNAFELYFAVRFMYGEERNNYRAKQSMGDIISEYEYIEDDVDFARRSFMEIKRRLYASFYYEVKSEEIFEEDINIDAEATKRTKECNLTFERIVSRLNIIYDYSKPGYNYTDNNGYAILKRTIIDGKPMIKMTISELSKLSFDKIQILINNIVFIRKEDIIRSRLPYIADLPSYSIYSIKTMFGKKNIIATGY